MFLVCIGVKMSVPDGSAKLFKWKLFTALTLLVLLGLCSFFVMTSENMTAWTMYAQQLNPVSTTAGKVTIGFWTKNVSLKLSTFDSGNPNTTTLKTLLNTLHTTADKNTGSVKATLNCSDLSSTLCRRTVLFTAYNSEPNTVAQTTPTADNMTQHLYITTPFRGRLGNQMCIYAALLGIARANNRRAFILGGTLLEKNFALTHIVNSISANGWTTIRQLNHAQFYPSFFNLPKQNITLWGYFISWKFLEHAKEEIRSEFTFRSEMRQQRDELFRKLRKEKGDVMFVGVHVRRGDFLAVRHQNAGFGVPQISYFVKAFKTMREMLSNSSLLFIVASDDLGWCERNLKASDVIILNQGSPGLHLAILAGCDHSVISGGTYSWWAAWLANGTTIYFANYPVPGTPLSKGFVKSDVYLPTWIPQHN